MHVHLWHAHHNNTPMGYGKVLRDYQTQASLPDIDDRPKRGVKLPATQT